MRAKICSLLWLGLPVKMRYTVSVAWHVVHVDWSSFFSKYEWLRYACSMRRRDCLSSSFLCLLDIYFYAPRIGLIMRILRCRSSASAIFVEWNGLLYFSCPYKESWNYQKVSCWADFAAESAWTFPIIPLWYGIQRSTIYLLFEKEFSLHRNFTSNWLSSFIFFIVIIGNKRMLNIFYF